MSEKIVVLAGGTGLIGRRLAQLLREQHYEVRTLTRRPAVPGEYAWDPAKGSVDAQALQGAYAVINLAGAGIADARWTDARKKILVESRTQSAHTLREHFRRSGQMPACYLGASAIGYYGNSGEALVYEHDHPVDGTFMVQCCEAWEAAHEEIGALGIRTVLLRIGVVLSKEGGALPELIKPLRLGLGAHFGDAWYSWIHRDDVCRMFLWALEQPQAEGVYNAVAPHPERNKNLMQAAAKAMKQWAVFAQAPTFALRLLLGEMSAVVLNSNRVSAEKILQAGFKFRYPDVESALRTELT